ncbi:MAG: hypothetical protein K2O67_03570, partial [Clostridia bacterium]|nr:hypothetical protein [Clostridia bacterium]
MSNVNFPLPTLVISLLPLASLPVANLMRFMGFVSLDPVDPFEPAAVFVPSGSSVSDKYNTSLLFSAANTFIILALMPKTKTKHNNKLVKINIARLLFFFTIN